MTRTIVPAGAPPRRTRATRRGRALLVIAVIVTLVLAIVLAARAVFGGLSTAPDYTGPGSGEAVVQVRQGDSLGDVGAALAGKGVVRSEGAFRKAAAAVPQAKSVQPGFYRLRRHMSAQSAVSLLLDPAAKLKTKVTIPEGMRAAQILDTIAANSEIPAADLKEAAADPSKLALPAYAKGRLEGFLFPATYQFGPGTTAVQALKTMVGRYDDAAAATGIEARSKAIDRSPYDVLIVASMIEKEAAVSADFGKVARVVYNRLDKGMPLQFDSTVNYALPVPKGNLSLTDIKVDSPYNTYRVMGLPPTPISNPGQQAIEAALNPTPGPFIYFVTIDKAGNSAFTDNYDEFLRLKKQGEAARR
ncbi:MAG: endolytic transglycosylase MltG [Actinomycetota bacterium]|nr:endolytic transglycosylase MltG [Actinomycetota bacterium]